MLDSETLEKILSLHDLEYHVRDINGHVYSDRNLERVKPPSVAPLNISTLTALVDYLLSNRDKLAVENLTVHVEDPRTVSVLGPLAGDLSRQVYLTANLPHQVFEFGRWFPQEDFLIALQTMFETTDDLGMLQVLASSITGEELSTSDDDGISQIVSTRAGVVLKDRRKVLNPVVLKPRRTFLEVDQPESPFVFRVRKGPSLCLFEADGGLWQNAAIGSVVEYLEDKLPGISVIG